jgi:hypothetical protein
MVDLSLVARYGCGIAHRSGTVRRRVSQDCKPYLRVLVPWWDLFSYLICYHRGGTPLVLDVCSSSGSEMCLYVSHATRF